MASGSVAKRLQIVVATLALLLSSSIVQADEVTGKIALVDSEEHTITLTCPFYLFYPAQNTYRFGVLADSVSGCIRSALFFSPSSSCTILHRM